MHLPTGCSDYERLRRAQVLHERLLVPRSRVVAASQIAPASLRYAPLVAATTTPLRYVVVQAS